MTRFADKRMANVRGAASNPSHRQKWLLIATAFTGVFLFLHFFSYGASAQTKMQRYVVQPGDTVWTIAVHVEPKIDPRRMTQEIEQVNHLDPTDRILPGETLLIPGLT